VEGSAKRAPIRLDALVGAARHLAPRSERLERAAGVGARVDPVHPRGRPIAHSAGRRATRPAARGSEPVGGSQAEGRRGREGSSRARRRGARRVASGRQLRFRPDPHLRTPDSGRRPRRVPKPNGPRPRHRNPSQRRAHVLGRGAHRPERRSGFVPGREPEPLGSTPEGRGPDPSAVGSRSRPSDRRDRCQPDEGTDAGA